MSNTIINDLIIDFEKSLGAEHKINLKNIGKVKEVRDEVVIIEGLDQVGFGETIIFENGQMGMIVDMSAQEVGAIVFDGFSGIKANSQVQSTGKVFSIEVSDEFLGRVVDGIGRPIDGGAKIKGDKMVLVDSVAPGVIDRVSVDQPLQTGIKAIDALVPIGRGQRELIIGDRRTGKSSLAIDAVINQKGKDVICIYNFIGAKSSTIAQFIEKLKSRNALDYSVIVGASSSDSSAIQYISPYVATAIAEYFMSKGKDVLIVYDDLSKHAWAYRQVSLVLRRPSGREAYPGDVFYLHSRLLERSCRVKSGGSITALPIIETLEGDVSAYIPTNVISITDGQIFLDSELFNSGIRPAISVGLSVSRVGGSAQTKAMKSVAGKLKLDLAQYRELAAFAQFEGDLDISTKKFIDRGARLTQLLRQAVHSPASMAEQVVVFWFAKAGYFDTIAVDKVFAEEQNLLTQIKRRSTEILTSIEKETKISPETENKLNELLTTLQNS